LKKIGDPTNLPLSLAWIFVDEHPDSISEAMLKLAQ